MGQRDLIAPSVEGKSTMLIYPAARIPGYNIPSSFILCFAYLRPPATSDTPPCLPQFVTFLPTNNTMRSEQKKKIDIVFGAMTFGRTGL
jgi:hypothetical protein